MDDSTDRTEVLQNLITETIAALGEEKSKSFEIEAYYECVEMDSQHADELCPHVRVIKR